MRAGKLRHRLVVKDPNMADRADGSFEENPTTATTIWAELVSSAGREFERAQQLHADITHLWRIRNLPTLTPKHYFLEGAVRYEIVGVHPDDNARWAMLVSSVETTV